MKISSLTPEQKTRLLAELDGWKYYPAYESICSHYLDNGKLMLPQDVKLYLTSYDAIIPLVQKLLVNEQIQIRFECALRKICLGDRTSIHKIVLLIPSQLCDAVLVATGKAEPCDFGDLLGVRSMNKNMNLEIEHIKVEVKSMDDGHNVKCPRCWHWHGVNENFGHLPEEIVANPKLAKEKLCDNCQQIILTDFPNHPAVPQIKAALAAQKTKYASAPNV
jgi:hypothetical protein